MTRLKFGIIVFVTSIVGFLYCGETVVNLAINLPCRESESDNVDSHCYSVAAAMVAIHEINR